MSALPPDRPRPSAGVDPSAVDDAAGFAAALTELRAHAALTIREVSRRTGIPSATLGGYFSGRHLPPPTQPAQLGELLTALGVPEQRHEDWLAALNRVRRIPGPRTPGKVTPYRGLEPYGVRDAAWFVGRDEVVDQLHDRVAELLEDDNGPRLVTLVGASGTGKSSLLRAGLMARLAMEGVTPVLLSPGEDPQHELATALAKFRPDTRRRLVVVDQLEEVFAEAVRPIVREAFLSSLIDLAEQPGCIVVTAIRADFYGHAVEDPTLRAMLRHPQVLVEPMEEASLRRVVVEPARRAGATVESELVELVLRDLSPRSGPPEGSALPMLSHALLSTWRHARNARLSVSDYVAVGGVSSSVQRTAEQVYGSLDEGGQATARWLFSQLVNVDEDGVATRRKVGKDHLEGRPELDEVIDAFASVRLLTSTEHTLEIAHEVLLTIWSRLGEWLEADREALHLRRRISLAARAWDAGGREPSLLLGGALLELARPLQDDPSAGLTTLERSFVAESLGHATEDERVRHRRDVGLRALFAVVVVIALIASGVALFLAGALDDADTQRDRAEAARDQATSRQVSQRAASLEDTSPSLAMQLALTAYGLSPTLEARSELLDLTGGPLVSRLIGAPGAVRAVSRPDGQLLATVHPDGVVRFWSGSEDAAPKLVSDFETDQGNQLYAGAFSPNGQLFVAAGVSGVVTVVDVSDPTQPRAWTEPLTGPTATVQDLAFSPDGRILYAATSDPGLFRWRLDDGEQAVPLRTITRFGGSVKSVATSSTGLVAAGSADGFVRVWEVRPRGLVPRDRFAVGTRSDAVHSVAFSPDGRLVAAGSRDQSVHVWSTRWGRQVADLDDFDTWVNAIAFSADGRHLAAGAFGGTARVWRTGTWQEERELHAPTTYSSVAFAPSGSRLLTGAIDGVTRIYRLSGPRLTQFPGDVSGLAMSADGHTVYVGVSSAVPQVTPVDFTDPLAPVIGSPFRAPSTVGTLDGVVGVSPDGLSVAAGTDAGQVVVWSKTASGAQPVAVLKVGTRAIEGISFGGDGRTFAAASADGRTALYELREGSAPRLLHLVRQRGGATSLSVNADSSLVAVGGADGLVHLWDVDGSTPEAAASLKLGSPVDAVEFSPDGQTLAASGANGVVQLWDVTSPPVPRVLGDPLPGATEPVLDLAFDERGDRLVGAGADGAVSLWTLDAEGGSLDARLTGLGAAANQVLFLPAGRVLAGGVSGLMTSWVSDVDTARSVVCRISGTPVTESEWDRYVPGLPYDPPCG